MKISPNNKKFLKVLLALLAVLFALYVFDLMKYKTRFNELKNDEIIELEIQVNNLQNKVDEITGQLEHNENAIKNADMELNLCKAKCKGCTYHLSANYEN
jgi:predicted Zn-ribbon and HTH transcriptional regulator